MTVVRDTGAAYLAVAIDHGESFDGFLLEWKVDPAARTMVKRGIIAACLELPPGTLQGLVVGNDLSFALPSIVEDARGAGVEVWVGLPDQVVQGSFDAARTTSPTFPVCAGLWHAHACGAVGVKTGFSLARHARWIDAGRWLEPAFEMAGEYGLQLVAEPYFSVQDTGTERENFLEELSHHEAVRFTKLDVHEPHDWGPVYKNGKSPWLARSEGLQFAPFRRSVTESLQYGCRGAMVGGAVWGVSGYPPLSVAYVRELQRRLKDLSDLVSQRSPTPTR